MSKFNRAVVIGGSVAGLFAAVALSETFDRVSVIDRDELVDGPVARKGVPQAKSLHGILPIGLQAASDLLPGLEDELLEDGAFRFDFSRDLAMIGSAGWHVRADSGDEVLCFTRPLYEWAIRRRVKALGNVDFVQASVVGLKASEDGTTVTGVDLATEVLQADFVVDASGRGSKSARWVEQLGFAEPSVQEVKVYMGYTTWTVRLPDGALPSGLVGLAAHNEPPATTRGALIAPCENGLHQIVGIGMMKDYPPRDLDGLIDFLGDVATPMIQDIARKAETIVEPASYTMPGNQRRVWEGLGRRPERFVVVGDAVASFNPVYAQGMSVAALEAKTMRDSLREWGADLDGFGGHFQQSISPVVDAAFAAAVAADVGYEGVEISNYEVPVAPEGMEEYFHALEHMATEDLDAAVAISRQMGWMDGEAPFVEHLSSKVKQWMRDGRHATQNQDPAVPPDFDYEAEKSAS